MVNKDPGLCFDGYSTLQRISSPAVRDFDFICALISGRDIQVLLPNHDDRITQRWGKISPTTLISSNSKILSKVLRSKHRNCEQVLPLKLK